MVSRSVRRAAAITSFAALTLVFAGSPAHAQCQGGGEEAGKAQVPPARWAVSEALQWAADRCRAVVAAACRKETPRSRQP